MSYRHERRGGALRSRARVGPRARGPLAASCAAPRPSDSGGRLPDSVLTQAERRFLTELEARGVPFLIVDLSLAALYGANVTTVVAPRTMMRAEVIRVRTHQEASRRSGRVIARTCELGSARSATGRWRSSDLAPPAGLLRASEDGFLPRRRFPPPRRFMSLGRPPMRTERETEQRSMQPRNLVAARTMPDA